MRKLRKKIRLVPGYTMCKKYLEVLKNKISENLFLKLFQLGIKEIYLLNFVSLFDNSALFHRVNVYSLT